MNVFRLSSHALAVAVGLLVLTALGGCGYHLRGAIDLPESLQRVYVDSDSHAQLFLAQLKNSLRGAGAEVVSSPSPGATTLRILAVDEQRATSSRDSNRDASQYRLGLNVRFATVSNANDETKALSASAHQILNYDPTKPLEMERQEDLLYEQMYIAVIQQMMRQLSQAR